MNYESFHESFCNALSSKIPNRKDLVDFISRELHLDKRAVYRRLEGDHQFRINEVLQICSLLDISVDSMTWSSRLEYQPPYFAYYPFGRMTEKEYDSLNSWINKYKSAQEDNESYVLLSCNILPDIFCFQRDNLLRLYKLKWAYYMDDISSVKHLDDKPVLQTAHLSAVRDYCKTVFKFHKLLIIWDYNIIASIIKDIEYFTKIGCLTQEHRGGLREDLLLIIDQIDELCKEFITPGAAGDFTFAISSTCLPKTHFVIKGPDFKMCIDSAFYTIYLHVDDHRIVESVEHIILATLKSSVIISQSNETERLNFINHQKELIEKI